MRFSHEHENKDDVSLSFVILHINNYLNYCNDHITRVNTIYRKSFFSVSLQSWIGEIQIRKINKIFVLANTLL